jgi:predicted amidophosphoribosyltransferase
MSPRACEACGRPLDSDHLHLCGHCAATIDRATDELWSVSTSTGLE